MNTEQVGVCPHCKQNITMGHATWCQFYLDEDRPELEQTDLESIVEEFKKLKNIISLHSSSTWDVK